MRTISSVSRRLPLPLPVSQLSAALEPALAAANAFVERVGDLPLTSWLAIGRAVMAAGVDSAEGAASWTNVERAIADHRLELAAWHVRDAVETIAYVASHSTALLSRADRRVFAAAHGAAEEAALAVLVRRHLPDGDFDRLCAPFAERGPLESASRTLIRHVPAGLREITTLE